MHRKNQFVQTDTELLRLLRQGDKQAFADVYERHKSAIYRYCLRMLADADAAEDATHDTFLKMYANTEQLHHAESFVSWLFRIARNEVLMYMRHNKRNETHSDETVWDESTPHEIVVSTEITELVQKTLQNLKSEYCEVVLLREYEQLSYAQIAEITGDTESSVKSRLFKARQAIAKKLRTYYQ
jgi:RNA polymerase sigma-70 factor (ECF subfamily)